MVSRASFNQRFFKLVPPVVHIRPDLSTSCSRPWFSKLARRRGRQATIVHNAPGSFPRDGLVYPLDYPRPTTDRSTAYPYIIPRIPTSTLALFAPRPKNVISFPIYLADRDRVLAEAPPREIFQQAPAMTPPEVLLENENATG